MHPITRRDLLKAAGFLLAADLPAQKLPVAWEWIRTCRGLICEAYNPPFYPSFDYEPNSRGRRHNRRR